MGTNERLEDLLDVWEDARESGEPISAESLCADDPKLLKLFKARIAAICKMERQFLAHQNPIATAPENVPASIQIESKIVDLRAHDSGGLGIVYKARDHELHRDVAVKFLHLKISQNPTERKKFHQEVEITGRLDHPGVVPVYAMGYQDNQPFYVMRFINGDTLDDAIKDFHKEGQSWTDSQRQVALQKMLLQLISVCQTIGYAHNRGIIHRDIKPKNIMLGRYGETLVVDWGLAVPFNRDDRFRVLDEATLTPKSNSKNDVNRIGEGTPVFMSPEQAAGKELLGPASDIYSLGSVLYRLLTGKFPFDGNTTTEIKAAILNGKFDSPRNVIPNIPRSLEAICVKAMELKPSERYPTAIEMAEDLQNFLADAPVTAYRYSMLDKTTILFKRYQKFLVTSLVVTAALLMASSLAATRFYKLQRQNGQSLAMAQSAQDDSLNLTCRMAAKSIQYNLESRLMALEGFANQKEIIDFVVNSDGKTNKPLRTILARQRLSLEERLPSVSWFVLDARGTLIARDADDDVQVSGQINTWQRPYFHGKDVAWSSAQRPKPLSAPYLSPVFVGRYQKRELCSLSVPISSNSQIIGVVVMTMQMGQFEPLIQLESSEAMPSRFATLVETRGEYRGLLLHHPGLENFQAEKVESSRVCQSVLEQLTSTPLNFEGPKKIVDYVDPFADHFSGPWNSSAIAIQVRDQQNRRLKCGWFLMVQDRPISY